MRRVWAIILLATLLLLTQTQVLAQEGQPESSSPDLVIFTRYPARVAELGRTVTFNLTLRNNSSSPQVVRLEVENVPEGWTATFRGGGDVIQAVYVEPDNHATVSLRLEPPEDVAAGTYRFVVVGRGEGVKAEFPIELTYKEKLPPKLKMEVRLPTLKGTPNTTFRYDVTLKNEGDEDMTVNLVAEAPKGFLVKFKSIGKEVTSLPLKANSSEHIDVEVELFTEVPAGTYPITVRAEGGEAQASLTLTAEVTGRPRLSVTAPDGRLSGQAYAGRESSLKVIVQNNGTAPALNVELSASEPSGWSVEFEPSKITEIPPGKQVEVTAKIRPAEKAVAGDYIVTIRAKPEGGASESADFRITVLTSTLWGVVGVGIIAVAVGVVALAVIRFGRR
ncbi:MAG TPA: hypothetical protein ENG33_05350 [Chloroflexi bacterium]|nr:hypothetical protein [Chloroflexota bacterium]